MIVAGYIGDATPGYDGNPDRKPIPGETNEDGNPQVSDVSTPHVPFAAPKRFIYDTLVNPFNPLPVGTCADGVDDDNDNVADDGCPGGPAPKGKPEPVRGPLIDFFLDMRAKLQLAKARYQYDASTIDCAPLIPGCFPRTVTIPVATVRGHQPTTLEVWDCHLEIEICPPGLVFDGPHDSLINRLVMAYIDAWIEDIDTGLENWSDLGLASTRALFDPRATRRAQDHICRNEPDDAFSQQRALCEDGVGPVDVLGHELEDFALEHLASMLGAPDAAGDVVELMGAVSDLLTDIFGPSLNPLEAPVTAVKEWGKDKVKEAIEQELHIDVDQLKSFVTAATHWLEVEAVTLELPGAGTRELNLFEPGTHAKLDALMHHHAAQQVKLPDGTTVASTGLTDDAVFDGEQFAAYRNTVQTAKLLLLDADGLNAALRDILVARGDIKGGVTTYEDGATVPANVMVDQLSGSLPWLRSIDSDHPWRADGRPRYCSTDDPSCTPGSGATPRPETLDAGNDTFPTWESCLLRPSFAALYRDWENGAAQFPALGDAPSADPSDPHAPKATLGLSGTTFVKDGVTYVGAAHEFTAGASDEVFTDARIQAQYRIIKAGEAADAWIDIAPNATFSIPADAGDGTYKVQLRTADPCHTFDPSDELEPGAPVTREVVLDTTPPEITIATPEEGSLVDGADNLGNATDATRTFELHATAESPRANIDRACARA